MRYEYLDALASSCLFGTALVGMTLNWSDTTTPRTERPSRFVAEEAWIGADKYRTIVVTA